MTDVVTVVCIHGRPFKVFESSTLATEWLGSERIREAMKILNITQANISITSMPVLTSLDIPKGDI